MFSTSLITVCLAGAATAFTPPGFQPSSTNDLAVAFNNMPAMNGVNLPQAATVNPPTIGTSMKLAGTYTLLMVDPDIPPAQAGGPTTELLHWMQTDMVSSSEQTTIGGMKVYEMTVPTNVSALASYIAPNPPNKAPTSHRYVQMLLNTTNLSASKNLTTLMKEAASRGNFNAVQVLKANGLTVLMGNSFNVTNAAALTRRAIFAMNNGTGEGAASASGVAGATGATGTTKAGTQPTSSKAGAEPTTASKAAPGGNGQTGTLTLDALLSTAAPGAAGNATARATAQTTEAPAATKATGPINSATLTFDALISTGGNQKPTAGARTNGAGGSPDAAPWLAIAGAVVAAIFVM
ncbi:hypothetical protein BP5796_00077 [Coleophoma crateriformis]|uniref:PEBP-like protein n=1 Tax=Coleophoma crateriformis TaxID=565419 RepID=A0A3D8T728_9HELO|nr:hypothetical protein BP5796_00077 [Coleophoma crateriformis]